jgi:hypothetical protein
LGTSKCAPPPDQFTSRRSRAPLPAVSCPAVVRLPPWLWKLSGCTGSRKRADRWPLACSHSVAPRPIAPPADPPPSAADSLPAPVSAKPRQLPTAARVRTSMTPPALLPYSGGT